MSENENNLAIEFTKRIFELYPDIMKVGNEHPKACGELVHVLGGLMSILLIKKGEAYYQKCLAGVTTMIDKTAREMVLDANDIAHGLEAPEPPTTRYSKPDENPS